MRYLLFFLELMLCTVGIMTACGLLTAFCDFLFSRLVGGRAAYCIHMGTSLVGTPVHELGHAFFCLIFAHRITSVRLWTPRSADSLGSVTHTYNRRNPWAVLGNLFIGLGPIFSGLAVLTLLLWLCFPATLHGWWDSGRGLVSSIRDIRGVGRLICDTLLSLGRELGHGSVPLWVQLVGLLLMFSVSQHVTVSLPDVRNAASSLPLWAVLMALVTGITALLEVLGVPALAAVSDGMRLWGMAQAALFTVVLVFAAGQLIPALLVGLIRLIVRLIR